MIMKSNGEYQHEGNGVGVGGSNVISRGERVANLLYSPVCIFLFFVLTRIILNN